MVKPTLVQSLLNQPSQTYANVALDTRPKQEYFSNKQEMVRIAKEAQREAEKSTPSKTVARANTTVTMPKQTEPPKPRSTSTLAPTRYPSQKSVSDDDDDDSDLDVYFTPNTSPRTSMASSVATITFPSGRKLSRRSLSNVSADSYRAMQLPIDDSGSSKPSSSGPQAPVPSTRTPSSTSHLTRARHAMSTTSSLSSTSLEGHSILSDFVDSNESTVLTTPYQSDIGLTPAKDKPRVPQTTENTRTSTASASKRKTPNASTSTSTNPSTSTPTPKSKTSNAESTNKHSSEIIDKIPTSSPTKKTPIQTKSQTYTHLSVGSRMDAQIKISSNTPTSKGKEREKEPSGPTTNGHVPVPSTTRQQTHTRSSSVPLPSSASASSTTTSTTTRPTQTSKSTTTPHSTISSSSQARSSSKKNDPVKSVQGPTTPSATPSKAVAPSSHGQTQVNGGLQMKAPSASSPQPLNTPLATPSTVPRTKKPPRTVPTIIGMDVVMEEDEEGPFTPRMEPRHIDGINDTSSWTSGSEGKEKSTPKRSLRHTSPKSDGSTNKHHRSTSSVDSSSSRSNSTSTPSKHSRVPPKTMTSEVNAMVYNSTGENRPSNATQGYTSLVLPRAPPSVSIKSPLGKGSSNGHGGWLSADGKVDLTKSGVAQTTMATVEVVRGLSGVRAGGLLGGLLGLGRKRSVSEPKKGRGPAPLPLPTTHHNTKGGVSGATARAGPMNSVTTNPTPLGDEGNMSHLKERSIDGTPLGFTSYRSPPNYVPSGSVLVQVWAVGVDGVDGRLVGVKFGGVGRYPEVQEDAYAYGDTDQEHERSNRNGYETEDGYETERGGRETDAEVDDALMNSAASSSTSLKKGPLASLARNWSLRLPKKKQGQAMGGQQSTSTTASNRQSDIKQSQQPLGKPSSQIQSVSPDGHKRSLSFTLKRNNTVASQATTVTLASTSSVSPNGSPMKKAKIKKEKQAKPVHQADVGYIPGRSFVGRVLECGWDVRDEIAKKGDWVIGLLDVRKAGALAEFIVVDRRKIQRVPQPSNTSSPTPNAPRTLNSPSNLTLEELALLPLCGLPAYRAVRTFVYAFSNKSVPPAVDRQIPDFTAANTENSSNRLGSSDYHDISGHRRRALVLRGHDGTGAMAVQMLVRHGWRVSVHVPFSYVPANATQEVGDQFMHIIEERAREWGADEVIFDDGEGGIDDGRGAAVRVLESLREDGDVFDAVLDTIGGKEVREAAERLLRSHGISSVEQGPPGSSIKFAGLLKRRDPGQFTTLIGDVPERAIPTAGDHFRAGLRSLRIRAANNASKNGHNNATSFEDDSDTRGNGQVGYAWISVAQDVDWEGDDVGETLSIVLRQALEGSVRPVLDVTDFSAPEPSTLARIVPFEDTPYVFVDNGPLREGATVVVRVAA